MSNPANNGTLIGRLAQDIKEFKNADGSRTLAITLAVDDNYRSGADKTSKAQFIPLRVFLSKTTEGLGSWGNVHQGDKIAVNTRLSCTPYEKDGATVYPPATVEVDGFPQYLDDKSVVDARLARKALASAPVPADETTDQKVARLEAQIAAQAAVETAQSNFDTTGPFGD